MRFDCPWCGVSLQGKGARSILPARVEACHACKGRVAANRHWSEWAAPAAVAALAGVLVGMLPELEHTPAIILCVIVAMACILIVTFHMTGLRDWQRYRKADEASDAGTART